MPSKAVEKLRELASDSIAIFDHPTINPFFIGDVINLVQKAEQDLEKSYAEKEIPRMSLRQYAAITAMQGLLANSGGPIQANDRTGWGLVNCTSQNIAVAAVDIADALLLELDREPDNQEDKLSKVSKQ